MSVMDKKTLLKVYQETTKEPYSFLYVKLTAKTIEDMFYSNFNKKVTFAKEVEPPRVSFKGKKEIVSYRL